MKIEKEEPCKEEGLAKLVEELSEGLRSGKSLTGKDGVFTPLLKRVLEAALEGELDGIIEDRRLQWRFNKPQSFGTWNLPREIAPIDDIDSVDNRRFEYNLLTLGESI